MEITCFTRETVKLIASVVSNALEENNLDENLATKMFAIGTKKFQLVRYDPRKPKYPFIAKTDRGSSYKLSADNLRVATYK